MKNVFLILVMVLVPANCFGQVSDLMKKKSVAYGTDDVNLVDESQLEQRVDDLEARVSSVENRLAALESNKTNLGSPITLGNVQSAETQSWGSPNRSSSGGCTGNVSSPVFVSYNEPTPMPSGGGCTGSAPVSVSNSMFSSMLAQAAIATPRQVQAPRQVEVRRTVRMPVTEVRPQNVRYEAMDCSNGQCRVRPSSRGVLGALRPRRRGF